MSDRGNQIAIKQFAINQFKREYKRKGFSEEELNNRREHLESYTPDSHSQAREHELRIKAIDELIS